MYTSNDRSPAPFVGPTPAGVLALILLGVLFAGLGAFMLWPMLHDPFIQCDQAQAYQDLPVDINAVPVASTGAWPIDVRCSWELENGQQFVLDRDEWTPTVLIYGGGLLAVGSIVAREVGSARRRRAQTARS